MVSQGEINTFQSRLLSWGQQSENYREFPWRQTTSPYEVLIAEVLLGATFAEKVVPIYNSFLERYPQFEALAMAETKQVAALLEPLGLHNRRAKALVKIGNGLTGEDVPKSEDELMELPYVGKYAANATLCFALGQRRPIVDSNVVRIYERYFGVSLNVERDETWQFAEKILPDENVREFNLALLDFGNAICQSSPQCPQCFLTNYCTYYNDEVLE